MQLRTESGMTPHGCYTFNSPPSRCFPHIVNLACKATLNAITDLKYVEREEQSEYVPGTFGKDCIATVCSFTNAVVSLYQYPHCINYMTI